MTKPISWGVLLLASAFSADAALAQTPTAGAAAEANDAGADQQTDIVIPGVVITGHRSRDIQKAATEVVSVLSPADIARSGDGDISAALSRVTGLSVVGNGFVYVRGLGDRYSAALLNGSPLPSPEPLRRAIPLDLFPTEVIASALVQKTYSPNFGGEFGGGVINLTTLAVPDEPFLRVKVGASADTETTGHVGYDHYGSDSDWTGYDDGSRGLPPALLSFYGTGQTIGSGAINTGDIARQLVTTNNSLVERITAPANYDVAVTGGRSLMLGENRLGVIAAAGFSNTWRTRDNIEQSAGSADLSTLNRDFHRVSTEDRAVADLMLGVGYESGENKLRWTNLYIHDTLKRTSLAEGRVNNQRPGADYFDQTTAWYQRQLVSTQLAGDFQPTDWLKVGARGSYSKSRRDAPFELGFEYVRTNLAGDPYGAYYVNRLDNQLGSGSAAFSNLHENLISGGLDATAQINPWLGVSVGYDYAKTERESARRELQIQAPSEFPTYVGLFRPDYLLGSAVIEYYGIRLIETTETDPAFAGELRTNAGYGQIRADITDSLALDVGARYEDGRQQVRPLQVFNRLTNSGASGGIDKGYVLPAATLTYRLRDDMQVRFSGSETLSRPQFRELMYQVYFDPENNRTYRGNPLLENSKFVNAEARFEWYFAPEQRFSVAGFYKSIDKPVEAYTSVDDNAPVTAFANAPEAVLYGAELEAQKYFPLDAISGVPFIAARRVAVISNYTYTTSKINVRAGDTTQVYDGTALPTKLASNYFTDGSRLTGQSDHIFNLQLGLEHPGRLSQQTFLLSYASDRVTSRSFGGLPDILESPGLRVDFVAREGMKVLSQELEAKLEVRNIFGRGYKEFQERGGNVVYYNKYDIGTSIALSLTAKF